MFIIFTIDTNIGPDGHKFEIIVADRVAAIDMCSILESSDKVKSYSTSIDLMDLNISVKMLSKYIRVVPS